MNTAYLVIGAIGSGKTVLADFLLSSVLSNIEYVGADIYKEMYFAAPVAADKRAYRCADEFVFYRIEQICKGRRDFVFEFCPTNANRIATTKYLLRKYAYEAVVLFVGTEDKQLNLTRCAGRETRGADTVPEQKIASRYDQSMSRILEMVHFSSKMYFIDNSASTPRLIALLTSDKLVVLDQSCRWFNQHVQHRLL